MGIVRAAHQHPNRVAPLALGLMLLVYLIATLPYIADYPRIESAQIGIIAPAFKLATQGVYGNDLFAGFAKTEQYNYEYMPLYPLTVGLSFRLLGVGVPQARLVSIVCGLFVLLLTYRLASDLFDRAVGLLAVAVLLLLPLAISQHGIGRLYPSALPLLDNARVVRYDIMVPVWVLASCLTFRRGVLASRMGSRLLLLLLTGVCGALATLTHLYGAFIMAVFVLLLLWQHGLRLFRLPDVYVLVAAWAATLIPWGIYILQDYAAYQAQMVRHSYRLAGFGWRFFADNLRNEFHRYLRIIGTPRPSGQWLRPAPWLMLWGLVSAEIILFKRLRTHPTFAHRFTFSVGPILMLLLALLVSLKRYAYFMLLYPFWAIYLALALVTLWRSNVVARSVWMQRGLQLLGLFFVASGLLAIGRMLQDARTITAYETLSASLASHVPQDARVVMLQDMWLGFAHHHQVRSLDIVFVEAGSPLADQRRTTAAAVMADLAPQYVVLSLDLLASYQTSPENFRPIVRQNWADIEAHLQTNCNLIHHTNATENYGRYGIFQCTTGDV